MKKNITICLLFFIGFWVVFISLQNPNIYFNTLGKISSNYYRLKDRAWGKEKKPFEKITNENTLHWDGNNYFLVKETGYSAKEDWLFAFFPLFPYIWKLLNLSPSQVIFLNFTLFAIGLLLLANIFKQQWRNILLVLSLPMVVVFLIPYTEATFFLLFSVAVWGYMKNKYWVYFVAMVLASLSRNTFLSVFPAILCAEALFLIKEKDVKDSLRRLFIGCLPVIIGTLIFSLIQYSHGSGSLFKFIEVQKYWGHVFSIPNLKTLRDWSDESFTMNVTTLVIVGIPMIFYVICVALKQLNILKGNNSFFLLSANSKTDYLNLTLLFCCFAAFISVLLYRGGSLHGLCRFVLCSPYFVILLFINQSKIESISFRTRAIIFTVLAAFSLWVLLSFQGFGFAYLGGFILITVLTLYIFNDFKYTLIYDFILWITFAINILWTTYLYNSYLCDGGLYT